MTREEAIAYGKDYYKDLITAVCGVEEKHKAFVKMAIEALQYLDSHHFTDLYVLDKQSGRIHRIGDDRHDSLDSWVFGEVRYHNLQNGDGGGVEDKEGYGYVILKTDAGYFNDEYGIIDRRYEKEIKAYLKENGYDVE